MSMIGLGLSDVSSDNLYVAGISSTWLHFFFYLKLEGLRRRLGAPHLGEREEEQLVVVEGEA